jgi:hypothetical protein
LIKVRRIQAGLKWHTRQVQEAWVERVGEDSEDLVEDQL